MEKNRQLDEIHVEILPDGRLTLRNAAKYLGIAYSTIRKHHQDPKWPPCTRIANRIFYAKTDLDKWLKGKYEITPSQ